MRNIPAHISLFRALRRPAVEAVPIVHLGISQTPRMVCRCGRVVSIQQCPCSMGCSLEQAAVKETGDLAKGLDLLTAVALFNSNILKDSGLWVPSKPPLRLVAGSCFPWCPEVLPSHPLPWGTQPDGLFCPVPGLRWFFWLCLTAAAACVPGGCHPRR